MLKKELLKLGLITTSCGILTTACLVGCSPNLPSDLPLPDINDVEFERIVDEGIDEINKEFEIALAEDPVKIELEDSSILNECIKATVVRVVDGDTYVVDIDGVETKVRLIGIDTPESVASQEYLDRTGKENTEEGKNISDYMKKLLSEGTALYLEFDVEKYDKYDRVLAYAYFSDGEMIQEHLLKKGYAQVMTIEPNVAYSERFVELEQAAMKEGVGIWNDFDTLFEETDKELEEQER